MDEVPECFTLGIVNCAQPRQCDLVIYCVTSASLRNSKKRGELGLGGILEARATAGGQPVAREAKAWV